MCAFLCSICLLLMRSLIFFDTIMLRDVHHQLESSGDKFEVICVPTHFQVELEKKPLEYDDYFNPYVHHLRLKFWTPFHDTHIDNHVCLNQIASTIGLPKDQETTHVILGPMNGSCWKVVTIFDSDFLKWHGAETYPFTIENIKQLAREDKTLRSGKHDLRTLLSSPGRDLKWLHKGTSIRYDMYRSMCTNFGFRLRSKV